MAAEPDTPEGERLDVLVTLVEAHENKHYRFDLPDPVEATEEDPGKAPCHRSNAVSRHSSPV
jgi:hypothetical protein